MSPCLDVEYTRLRSHVVGFDVCRGPIPYRRVQGPMVVEGFDPVNDVDSSLGIGVVSKSIGTLDLQGLEEALHRGVSPRLALRPIERNGAHSRIGMRWAAVDRRPCRPWGLIEQSLDMEQVKSTNAHHPPELRPSDRAVTQGAAARRRGRSRCGRDLHLRAQLVQWPRGRGVGKRPRDGGNALVEFGARQSAYCRAARRIFDKPKEIVLISIAIARAAGNMHERQRPANPFRLRRVLRSPAASFISVSPEFQGVSNE